MQWNAIQSDVCIRVLWTSDRHGRTNLSLKDLRCDTNSIIYAQNNPEYGVTIIRGPGIRTRLLNTLVTFWTWSLSFCQSWGFLNKRFKYYLQIVIRKKIKILALHYCTALLSICSSAWVTVQTEISILYLMRFWAVTITCQSSGPFCWNKIDDDAGWSHSEK